MIKFGLGIFLELFTTVYLIGGGVEYLLDVVDTVDQGEHHEYEANDATMSDEFLRDGK